jgi:hypothetical protein
MKTVLECPECGSKWEDDTNIELYSKSGNGGRIVKLPMQEFKFCIQCMFGEKEHFSGEVCSYHFLSDYYLDDEKGIQPRQQTDYCRNKIPIDWDFFNSRRHVLLKERKLKVTHIVVNTEFGYMDLPIDDAKEILPSRFFDQFDDDIDDHNSTWGGAGPDCITKRLEAAKL